MYWVWHFPFIGIINYDLQQNNNMFIPPFTVVVQNQKSMITWLLLLYAAFNLDMLLTLTFWTFEYSETKDK